LQFTQIHNPFERAIRDDSGKYRVYKTPKGIVYPSVTSFLKKIQSPQKQQQLQHWKDTEEYSNYITKQAIDVGNETHKLIEDYLKNKPTIEMMEYMSIQHFERLKPFLHKITEVHGVEEMLYSDVLKLAGTADGIVKYDGKLSLIDYKTKRKDQRKDWLHDYFLQATAYSIMWEELSGDIIEQIVILVSSKKGQCEEFIVNPNDFKEELLEKIT